MQAKDRKTYERIAVIAAYLGVVIVNYLANAIPIAGRTTGEISDRFASLFTPAGFTFSIWGLIYFGLGIYAVYQALPARKQNGLLARITWPFLISCLANAGWILAWHHEQVSLALAIMVILALALLRIYLLLTGDESDSSMLWKLCVHLPFSIYLAWITVALLANLTVVQVAHHWQDAILGRIDWTLVKLAFAIAIGALAALRNNDFAFVLVIGWAAFGISAGQAGSPVIAGAATLLVYLSVLLAAMSLVRNRQVRRA